MDGRDARARLTGLKLVDERDIYLVLAMTVGVFLADPVCANAVERATSHLRGPGPRPKMSYLQMCFAKLYFKTTVLPRLKHIWAMQSTDPPFA